MLQELISAIESQIAAHWLSVVYIVFVLIAGAIILKLINRLLYKEPDTRASKQSFPIKKIYVQLSITAVVIILILLGLPGISNNIVQLIGIGVGAIVAFSSSTLIANLMSGVLIKIIEPYKEGDMIEIHGDFGKVFDIGLFHTELQTPKREILHIPNLVAMSGKISNYSQSGYIVNVTAGIGYDVPSSTVEALMINAISKTGLKNPFVLIKDLGNYAVTYEANGLLTDPTILISAKSNLRRNILHEFAVGGIEIMSPMHITNREMNHRDKVIPPVSKEKRVPHPAIRPEKMMYEKADLVVKEKEDQKAADNISVGMRNMLKKER